MPKQIGSKADKQIGSRVRSLRRAQLLTQRQLAKQIGVSYQQVQKYETGHSRISISMLLKLAQVLGAPVNALYETAVAVPNATKVVAGTMDFQNEDIAALVTAFTAIRDVKIRKQLIALVRAVATTSGPR